MLSMKIYNNLEVDIKYGLMLKLDSNLIIRSVNEWQFS